MRLQVHGFLVGHITYASHSESFRIVRVLVVRQATVHRLTQHARQLMLRVLVSARITKQVVHHRRQFQCFIEFAIRNQSRVEGDG